MKKALKIILPLAAILIAAGLCLAWPMLVMRPAKTGQIPLADGQYLAIRSGRGAMYLTDTGDGYLAIDAGTKAGSVKAGLAALGIDPAQVKWVLLTHSDYDHVAALPLFENAEIYMGEGELGLLNGTVNRNASGGNKLPDGIGLDAIQLLQDGDELLFGGVSVKCVAAPGHTPGSMAYLVSGDRHFPALFTGDALRPRIKGNSVHPFRIDVHPYTMDKARAEETIAALPATGVGTVLTSHYGYYFAPAYGE
jgi:glyoxylase-like metal-dependent hydrolase (beta-lactamase superfamily II)